MQRHLDRLALKAKALPEPIGRFAAWALPLSVLPAMGAAFAGAPSALAYSLASWEVATGPWAAACALFLGAVVAPFAAWAGRAFVWFAQPLTGHVWRLGRTGVVAALVRAGVLLAATCAYAVGAASAGAPMFDAVSFFIGASFASWTPRGCLATLRKFRKQSGETA